MSNLLCVDFDFFFFSPAEAGHARNSDYGLFDWSHSERPMFIDGPVIWPSRASAFWERDRPLPRCDVPADFWSRFRFTDDCTLFVSDSNSYAGVVASDYGDPFEHVYLLDAHHDCYGVKTEEDFRTFVRNDKVTCENWMFAHLLHGSKLHWRWPEWLTNGFETAKYIPEWIGLDAQQDDGEHLDVVFDTVALCRSGAWVPPWCDDQFADFLMRAPIEPEFIEPVMPREWEPMARVMHDGWQRMEEMLGVRGA